MGHTPSAIERWLPTPLLRVSAALQVAALAALAAAPRRWRLWATLLLADHVLLAAAGMTPRGQLLGPALTRLPAGAGERVGLTFDDGPDPRITPAVLALLDAAGARASFFVIGRRGERHPALIAEIVRRGHRVENHTHRHSNLFACLPPAAAAREVARAQRAIGRLAGRPPAWFRAPAGIRSPWLHGVLAGHGLRLASWSRRGFDTVDGDPRRVAGRLTRGLAAGDVLLLHDGATARTEAGRPVVLEALPRLLDALAARGLAAVPLPAGAAR